MRIAISGSHGFVGSALCKALAQSDHEIIRLVRPNSHGAKDRSSEQCIEWDPQTGLTQPTLLSCDALVHLAGRNIAGQRWTRREKGLIRQSRIHATTVLAEQIAQIDSPPRMVISASAIGFYGERGDRVTDETTPKGAGFLAEVAAGWEHACTPLTELGIRVVHPRLGIVLARHGGALGKMLPVFRLRLGGRLGSGNQFWSWISLSDCVAAILWMIDNDSAFGPYNLVAPEPVTNREFTSALARQLRVPAILPVPAFALRMAMGEMADALLLSSCRVKPSRLSSEGFQFQHANLADFLVAELGQ